jgi:tight adherence protein C
MALPTMDSIADKIVIPALTFLSIMAVGASILLAKAQRRKTLETRIQDGLTPAADTRSEGKKKSGLVQLLEKIGNVASHGRASTTLWEELVRAGYYSRNAPAVYTGAKLILFGIGFAGAAVFVVPSNFHIAVKINLIFLSAVSLFFLPNVLLKTRLKKRHDEISLHLPEAVDLLEICVSSGIGLGMAWNIVADEILHVSPTLAGAMALTNFEIHLGVSRIDAMRHMAARTGVDKLASLAATLVQTERFGTSIATALKEFAQSMREERYFTAEERAEKMAVKLIIPMVLFIFPAVLITVAGPAVIAISKMMRTY